MKQRIKSLYSEAGEFVTRARAILDAHEGKAMPQEKANEYDSLMDQYDAKTAEAKRMERQVAAEAAVSAPINPLGASGALGDRGRAGQEPDQEVKDFRTYLATGKHPNPANVKTLQADNDAGGGFLVAPQQMAAGILKFVDDLVVIRGLATVEQIGAAESLGIVTMDTDMSDASWTSELGAPTVDTVDMFGKRALTPHPLTKEAKISKTLIRKSTKPIEAIVQQRLGYRVAVTQEKAYLTGSGAQQPLGMFTPSAAGISTSRDTTCAATTVFTADELIDLKYSLKAPYQSSRTTRWLVHRDFVKRTRKLKDGTGAYIWGAGLGGTPETILDIPVVQSEHAPNTFTASQYIALLGDLSFYWIVDSLQFSIQVLLELYARTNQNGYIARYEGDGMPVLEEAFARLILHA